MTAAIVVAGCAAPDRTADAKRAEPAEKSRPAERAEYVFPIAGGNLPEDPKLLPNAPRAYRGGVHEGVDLFTKGDGAAIICGEPVLNARRGWIIRADHDWNRLGEREYKMITSELKTKPDADRLDRLRGRQVWVRSDDGVVIRYCHLRDIAAIRVGLNIGPGTRIGTVGNTGTSDGSRGTGGNCHLHFEIWPKATAYLGKGASSEKARRAYAALFER
jgi:murein DD-endopeptidase MepM/ murein hydrolase activator NlpD